MDVSILVISYNTRELTLECLKSIYRTTHDITSEVIVLDNASTDGSAEAIREAFPPVHLITSEKNLGFAGGNNVAAQQAQGDYILLLNPDTVLRENAVKHALDDLRLKPAPVLMGGRTFFGDGTLNANSCHGRQTPWSLFCKGMGLSAIFRRSVFFDSESLGRWPRDTARPVDCITGCFLLISRVLWNQLGGFDEAFFMYGEDTDLCLRARAMGVASWICPAAELTHYGGQSERIRADKMVRLFVAKAQLIQKHWPAYQRWFGIAMLDLWAFSRAVVSGMFTLIRPRCRDSFSAWKTIWSRRREWHVSGIPVNKMHVKDVPRDALMAKHVQS